MNDFYEFAEIALGMFVALPALIWLLTHLELTLLESTSRKRPYPRTPPAEQQAKQTAGPSAGGSNSQHPAGARPGLN